LKRLPIGLVIFSFVGAAGSAVTALEGC